VVALDINPFQNYLLRLKIAAFKLLTHDEILEFFGIRQSARRMGLYEKIRMDLDDESRAYWNRQEGKLRQGIIHAGRFEQYMKLLRFWVRRLVGQDTIEAFFNARSARERSALYQSRWENIFWLLFTRLFLSRTVMTLLFDKAFFEQIGARFSFGKHFAGKTRHALTELPVRENYFLSYILLGRYYSENAVPSYLRKEHYETIRSRLDRVEIVTDSCEHFFSVMPPNSVSKFNFTNIFEWMAPERCEALLRETIRVAEDGAILTYRNLLVSRSSPDSLRSWIKPLEGLAESLLTRDLSFIYNRYVVESIQKDGVA
jgi:S-adenosylmethionine-diacylglycerol 3-amino-3-carboxypropyl transferase